MNQPLPNEQQPAPKAHLAHLLALFFGHLLSLPRWQKTLLALAAFAGGAGLVVRATSPQPAVTTSPSSSAAPLRSAPHSGAFDTNSNTPVEPDIAPPPSAPAKSAPWYGRVGISIVLGFILGWITRLFVKLTALIAALFATALGALSYFHIANVDLTAAASTEYKTASAWVTDQADRLKKVALAHIPSTSGGFVGIYLAQSGGAELRASSCGPTSVRGLPEPVRDDIPILPPPLVLWRRAGVGVRPFRRAASNERFPRVRGEEARSHCPEIRARLPQFATKRMIRAAWPVLLVSLATRSTTECFPGLRSVANMTVRG